MGNSKESTARIILSFERIFKGTIAKLEDGDKEYVLNSINWIDNKINSLFQLSKSDFQKFKKIVDPTSNYSINEPIDISWIDWINVKDVPSQYSSDSRVEKREDLRIFISDNRLEQDIFYSLLEESLKLFNAGIRTKNLDLCFRVFDLIGNIYSNIVFSEDTKFNFRKLFSNYCTWLTNYLLNLSNKNQDSNIQLLNFVCFRIHLTHFKQQHLPEERFDIIRESILQCQIICLRSKTDKIVKNFIQNLVEGGYTPSMFNNHYADFYSFVEKDLKPNSATLNSIPELTFRSIKYSLNREQYNKLLSSLDDLQSDLSRLTTKDSDLEKISKFIYEAKEQALRWHKYRLIQRTLVSTLVYSISIKNFSLVDLAFEFNQPPDADAIWSNKEILPGDLDEILGFILIYRDIEHELMFKMPGHHGVTDHIEVFFIKSLKNWYLKNHLKVDLNSEINKYVNLFCSTLYLKNNASVIDGLMQRIIGLRGNAERLFLANRYPFETKSDKRIKNQIIALFKKLEVSIKGILDHIETDSIIPEKTLETFISNVVQHFNDRTFYRKLINDKNTGTTSEGGSSTFQNYTIGFNEIIDRSYFIENWHTPTVGTVGYIGNRLAEQEDYFIEREIDKRWGNQSTIQTKNIKDKVLPVKENEIIIFKNYWAESVLQDDVNFVPNRKLDKLKDEPSVIGKYKNSIIYYYHSFGSAKLIMLDNMGKLVNTHSKEYESFIRLNNFFYKIIDFSKDSPERVEFIKNPPEWLVNNYDRSEYNKILSTKIWIRIYGKFIWETPAETNGKLYIIEKE